MEKKNPMKRILILAGVIIAVFMTLVTLLIIGLISMGVRSKSSAPRSPDLPQSPTADAVPIGQFESHTCGFLALSSAYRVYGLSPEDKNIRFRLGVDRLANPFDDTTQGTLHPDLFRVLAQDGFAFRTIDPSADRAESGITDHLNNDDLLLLLIQRRENRALHWVLADHVEQGLIRVVDSLASDPYMEPLDEFLECCVISVIPISIAESEDDGARPHQRGIAEMNRARVLIAERKAESGND